MKFNIKKLTAAAVAASMLTTGAAVFAKDNFYAYNKFMVNVEIPQNGLCDTLKSYIGHDDETAVDYFSGVISAFTSDIDGDGDLELFVVEGSLIKIYGAAEDGSAIYLADVQKDLITDMGESYANVFIKPCGAENLLCVEYFSDTGASKGYSLKIYAMDSATKSIVQRAKIEKSVDDDSLSEAVSGILADKIISYSNSTVKGNEFVVNPDNYENCEAAAEAVLLGLGFESADFIKSENRLNLYASAYSADYSITNFIKDVIPETYIRAVGIRNGDTPLVIFNDYSMLEELSAPVSDITVTVNGETVQFKNQEPIIKDGRTLVPVRGVFEAMGANVDWLQEAQKAVVNTPAVNITLTLNSDVYYVNGEAKKLDVPAMLINDRTMVPVRAISESLGCDVQWDDVNRVVVITTVE